MHDHKAGAFTAKRVTRSYCQTIDAEPTKVHALICPVKEAEWLDGWEYDMIYSESGRAEAGCVFTSRQAGEADTIWLITKRDDERHETEFARITPGSRVATVTVRVRPAGRHKSKVHITYVFTALSAAGNRLVENFTEENFIKDMQFWEASMNHFLKTGKPLVRENRSNWLRYPNKP